MASRCPGKNVWPELLGANGRAAAAKIERDNPGVHAIILPEGSPVTRDFRCDRVWVFINPNGRVARVPRIT